MKRVRTRFLYMFERGRPIKGWALRIGRLGAIMWVR